MDDEQRARKLMRQSGQRIDGSRPPGRPRIGTEVRIPVSARIEPATAQQIEGTGLSLADVLERTAYCIANNVTWAEANRIVRDRQRPLDESASN